MRLICILLLVGWMTACAAGPIVSTVPVPPPPLKEVAGYLSGETHLSGEVLLADDILVPRGATLVIHPGTLIVVRPSDSTKIDPEYLSAGTEILVRGTLKILGTREAPVRFTPPEGSDTAEPAWAGILLDRAEDVLISHAQIENAETGILCIGTSAHIVGASIFGARYGFVAQQGSSPALLDSTIEKGEGGVFIWRGSSPVLRGNRILGNQEEGVFIDATSRPSLEGNEISGNAVGVALYPRDLPFDPDQARGNGEDVRLLGSERTP